MLQKLHFSNIKCFISGTVKLHADDIVDKSELFRKKNLIKKKSQRSCSLKKGTIIFIIL